MGLKHLEQLFRPKSIAVIGASNTPRHVGQIVMHNLLMGGFKGPVMPVNPKHKACSGVFAYPSVESLPETPDLAIVATPPATVPKIIADLGARGTKAAVIMTAGLSAITDVSGRTLSSIVLEEARRRRLRILGPNCIGVIVPGSHLNASFAHLDILPGKIAFVSQSGALCTSVIDWAKGRGIGFSHFVSMGDVGDISFGDMLDYLATEPSTSAILLYIESITQARQFMSAARTAARNKPVLAIKAGRVSEGARAATSHTGALAGADDVYDTAMARAGILRVYEIEELFDAVETLARANLPKVNHLTILTNGGGPGVMATDYLMSHGGALTTLSKNTLEALDHVLPKYWSRGNPIDIIGDATPSRYADAVRVLLAAPEVDTLLVMHSPTAIGPAEEQAKAVADVLRISRRNHLLTCWLGGQSVELGRKVFRSEGIPTYDTPEQAVLAFLHLVQYRRSQELLMETPHSIHEEFTPATAAARLIVENALAEGRDQLSEPEAKAVLAAYGIPVVETHIAKTPEEAVRIAENLDFPVALKILSPDIIHKTEVGGVALDLESVEQVLIAAQGMATRVLELMPTARLNGFSVQKMARLPGAHELIVGASSDPVFGPVILFGHGGLAVEVVGDRAVSLPPLNMNLAGELISRTRISKLLAGYRGLPAADLDAIELTLIQVAQIVVDLPEVAELDINPLFADQNGVLALDARMRVRPATSTCGSHLAIHPYPKQLEEHISLPNYPGAVIRPIRPEDEPAHHAFLARLLPEDIRLRYFSLFRELPHAKMARYTQIDYDREMAFILSTREENGITETLGEVRTVIDPDNRHAEFALVVRSDLKGKGLGTILMNKMLRYCRSKGTPRVYMVTLMENVAMQALAKKFDFHRQRSEDGETMELWLDLV